MMPPAYLTLHRPSGVVESPAATAQSLALPVLTVPMAVGAGLLGGALTGAFYGALVGVLACAFAPSPPRPNPAKVPARGW